MLKAILIPVRSDSSRLPKKALVKINGLSTIEHLIQRVKRSKKADKIIVCTTTLQSDDEICTLAEKNGVNYYRGSVEDKLNRCLEAAIKYDVDYFVNVDGDDLFCEPELIDLAFEQYELENHDFVKSDEEKMVCGAFTFGIKTSKLKEVCANKNTNDTEIVWLSFLEDETINSSLLQNVADTYYRPEIRATLDYEEDLFFFETIIKHFWNQNKKDYTLKDIISFIDNHPEVALINEHRKTDWLNNQKRLNTNYRS